MDSQRLRTDVPPEVYAYMVLNAPTMTADSNLAQFWIQKGIEAHIMERREKTGKNLQMNQQLMRALETYLEHGEIDRDAGTNDG